MAVQRPWLGGSRARFAPADVLIPVLLGVATAAPLLHGREGRWWVWVLDVALVVPLVVRRRWPSAVFMVLAAVAFAQWLAGVRLIADITLLLALFTVAAHEERRRAVVAAAVLELGVVLASVRFAPAGGDVARSLVFMSGLVAAALFIGTTLRTRRAYLLSLVERAAQLERERDQQARLAATAERTRIAREMHDIVAHNLSVMISLADGAALTNRTDPQRATDAMAQVSVTGRRALAEMRRLLGVLREERSGDMAPQPGLGQLDSLIEQVRAAGLPVRVAVSGQPRTLLPTAEATAYRVVQEALTNCLKHAADASMVRVALRWSEDTLAIDVADDGRPNESALPSGGHAGHGLAGMRERVAMYGGNVTAGPSASGGWEVRAELPLDQETP